MDGSNPWNSFLRKSGATDPMASQVQKGKGNRRLIATIGLSRQVAVVTGASRGIGAGNFRAQQRLF
jgi:hypothetical protein